jgi:hypothetical protein
LGAVPAFAQSSATDTKQNAAVAGGQPGAIGSSTRPRSAAPAIPNSNPSAPHSGVSEDAAAAGGSR